MEMMTPEDRAVLRLVNPPMARMLAPQDGGDMAHFGVCPTCWHSDGFLNVERQHWFVCHVHHVKWHVGSNTFSCWIYENEEDWRKNLELLSTYREVESVTPLLDT